MEAKKVFLHADIPRQRRNIQPDIPVPWEPALDPGTDKPINPIKEAP